MRKCLSEFLGTFSLVFAGTSAIVVDDLQGGVLGHLGVALCFGLVVLVMIYTLGGVSGAHFNPAVTTGFFAAGQLGGYLTVRYVVSQLSGAVMASTLVALIFPFHHTLGVTSPVNSQTLGSFSLEVILTWMLMLVILSVATGSKD